MGRNPLAVGEPGDRKRTGGRRSPEQVPPAEDRLSKQMLTNILMVAFGLAVLVIVIIAIKLPA
jgi:hypothetical protein